MPNISGKFGRLEDPFGDGGLFSPDYNDAWGVGGGSGGGNMSLDISRLSSYAKHIGSKLQPDHYVAKYYIKYR